MSDLPPAISKGASRRVVFALGMIVILAGGARAWLLFSTPWVPGMSGAYYLVQARALLERGTLGLPDMPLLFHLHAGLAWVISVLGRQSLEASILFATKATDALLPPLAAIPVFVVVFRWAASAGRPAITVPLAAAALAVLASPLMGMVGDFQKNSLALVWLAWFALALRAWLERHDPLRGASVLVCLFLLGLTHIGVLGSALLLAGAVMLAWFVLGGRLRWASLTWLLGGAGVVALAAGLVLWKFDPTRIHRLAGAFTNPAGFAKGSEIPMPMGGGPFALLIWLPFILFVIGVAPALLLIWRGRKALDRSDAAVAAGCALLALALTGPWFSFDKAMRFQTIALIPGILAAAYALLQVSNPWRRNLPMAAVLLLLISPTLLTLRNGGRPILSNAALTELAGLREFVPAPERTLIAAQHGPEWWTAWLLHTHIAQGGALKPDDWIKYESVMFLEVKSGLQMGGFLPGMRPGGRAPVGMPQDSARPKTPAPRGRGGTLASLMAPPIPPNAQVLHDGPNLKLARVLDPPASLTARP